MITGAVTGNGDPLVQVFVRDTQGQQHPINCVIDTGFNGYLALSPARISKLALVAIDTVSVELADKSRVQVPGYEAIVLWDGQERAVPVTELAGDPLIGTALLYHYEVTIQFVNGGPVTLKRLP